MAKKMVAKKAGAAASAGDAKLKFGSPEWQAKYGRGKAKTAVKAKTKK